MSDILKAQLDLVTPSKASPHQKLGAKIKAGKTKALFITRASCHIVPLNTACMMGRLDQDQYGLAASQIIGIQAIYKLLRLSFH